MPATALNPAEQFSALDGLTVLFLPVVAATTLIPTRAEINAGTDLSTELADPPEGFTLTSEKIDTPKLAKRFTGSIPGRITAEDSSMMLYTDRGGDDVRDVLPRDTKGFIVLMDSGDVPGDLMDVWPVQVNALTKVRAGDAATMHRVTFNITELPAEDVVIPTTP